MPTHPKIVPVILCGGRGTRLWPMSRASRPKQFLPLTGDLSLFQKTLLRVSDPDRYLAPIVITNDEYRFLVAEQAQECGLELKALILEPVARNTAPAIAAASFVAMADGEEDILLHILPSDHEIVVDGAYLDALNTASVAAAEGYLTTFGIKPTEPATGFGYIEAGETLPSGAKTVGCFVEKPVLEKAQEMLAAGNFYWNSGMFLFRPDVFLNELERFAAQVYLAAKDAVEKSAADLDFIRLDAEAFSSSPDVSVDYAVFEKTNLMAVVPSPIVWSDLGSWDAVWKASPRDENNNLTRGPAMLLNTSESLVVSERLHVVVDGLDDVAVIATEDAVYVGQLSKAQNVGSVVKILSAHTHTKALTDIHQTSYRPWGGYSSILMGERFQVKRLFVKPGKRLSLQKHHHRSEHWIVVRGTAEVQIGNDVRALRENESIYIPQGELHRLSNPGKILLELIEVQTGSYLAEDDIIRVEDEFGRK